MNIKYPFGRDLSVFFQEMEAQGWTCKCKYGVACFAWDREPEWLTYDSPSTFDPDVRYEYSGLLERDRREGVTVRGALLEFGRRPAFPPRDRLDIGRAFTAWMMRKRQARSPRPVELELPGSKGDAFILWCRNKQIKGLTSREGEGCFVVSAVIPVKHQRAFEAWCKAEGVKVLG